MTIIKKLNKHPDYVNQKLALSLRNFAENDECSKNVCVCVEVDIMRRVPKHAITYARMHVHTHTAHTNTVIVSGDH